MLIRKFEDSIGKMALSLHYMASPVIDHVVKCHLKIVVGVSGIRDYLVTHRASMAE